MMLNQNKKISSGYEDLFVLSPAEELRGEALILAAQFLDLIHRTMQERKMSRKKLAHLIGTSPSWLTQIFRGDKLPNLETLVHIGKVLDLSYEILDKSYCKVSEPVQQNDMFDLRRIELKTSPSWLINKPDWGQIDYHKKRTETEPTEYPLPMSA